MACLAPLVQARDWQGLSAYLGSLSHSQFRTAGYVLGERIGPELGDKEFWELAGVLTAMNGRAFLVTMLKSALVRGVDTNSEGFRPFCLQVRGNAVDRQKTIVRLLPAIGSTEGIESLFAMLGVPAGAERVPYLLRVDTLPASYALFVALRFAELDRPLLVRTLRSLVRKGDNRSFNLASLLKTYFGLDEVTDVFARPVAPYELSRIAGSYKAFVEALER